MTDAVHDAEVALEQRYLDRVYARLAQLRASAAEAEKAGYGIAAVGNFGAYVERDAMVYHAAKRRHTLDAEYEGLVFGRLDLGPEGRSGADAAAAQPAVPGGEVRYVGRLGLRDEYYESLVVDWRAPAAAAFYQATPTRRMGVVRRRTIHTSGEQVLELSDDLLDPDAAPAGMPVVGDGAMIAALSRATQHGMRDIVATIQQEQDEAIRSPASGVTMVDGGPGTGKTAVALHRVAYLLYSDRNRFESGGVLVVGPSAVFVNYVARVLPSLGEDTVTLRSLGDLAVGFAATRQDDPAVAAVKGSLRMIGILRTAARSLAPNAPAKLRILYRGELLSLDRFALRDVRRTVLGTGGHRNAIRPKAAGHLLDAMWRQSLALLPKSRHQSREDFAQEIAERREFIDFMNRWWPILRPMEVLGWLADPALLHRFSDGTLTREQAEAVAADFAKLHDCGPSVADIALLDELGELLGHPARRAKQRKDPFHVMDGVREVTTFADRMAARRAPVERPEDYRDYAHIVVDEAQDVSPMQWRMIARRGPYASWTIVGDPAQSAWPDPAEARRAMERALGTRKRSSYSLTTNYRNSAEIFDLAARVIRRTEPKLKLPRAVRVGGVSPRTVTVAEGELAKAVLTETRTLLDQVKGTVGVIAALDDADRVAGWLAEIDDPRLQVLGSLQSKGVEYDGVMVVEPMAIIREAKCGVRTLYVALSRATQRLVTVDTDRGWLD